MFSRCVGSTYSGQVLDQGSSSVPYGYGHLATTEKFHLYGNFINNKSAGEGIFIAPNKDTFYGIWNDKHKRCGKGLFRRAADGYEFVEE